ncbi:MAG: hypothetical protein WA053_00005 [Minisyncoccia bacterium]
MRKNLLAAVVLALACASAAMAHGPPSVLDQSVVAQASISPTIVSGGASASSSNGKGSGSIKSAPLFLAGLSKTAPAGTHGAPPNERMLN